MGIFSFGKKDEAPARRGSRSGSGRRSNDGVRVERRSRRPDRSGDAEAMLLDPTLPEKQRARRRLVGAIALVIAAVIVLPMILDTHPKPVTDDIAIDIPSRPAPKASARDDATDTQAGVAPDNPPAADTAQVASGLASTDTAAATPKSAQSTQTAQAAQAQKPAASSSKQPAQSLAQTQPRTQPGKAATTAQRQAIPSDTDVEPGSSSGDAGTPSAPPGARYALQLGSFADDASARNWESKLKAAGVPAYTEHRKDADGKTRTLLRAGPFPDRAAASAAIAKVRSAGLGAGANNGGAE